MLLKPFTIAGIDLVAMSMTLRDFGCIINPRDLAATLKYRLVSAEPHGSAEFSTGRPFLQFVASHPLRHEAHDGMSRCAKLRGIGILDAAEIACGFDHRHLHAEANSEIWHFMFTRELGGANLALRPALTKPAGHQDAIDVLEKRHRVFALEHLGFDPVEIDLDLVGDAAVRKRLDKRLIGVLHAGILADDG